MKKDFILKAINGYGETTLIKFHAYNLREAQLICHNYCIRNMIVKAVLITHNGQKFVVK